MTEEQIKDAWTFIEGKAAGLNEAGKPVNFPVLFAQYILEVAQLQRKWVGLTDEDFNNENYSDYNFVAGMRWAEFKLKGRNT